MYWTYILATFAFPASRPQQQKSPTRWKHILRCPCRTVPDPSLKVLRTDPEEQQLALALEEARGGLVLDQIIFRSGCFSFFPK